MGEKEVSLAAVGVGLLAAVALPLALIFALVSLGYIWIEEGLRYYVVLSAMFAPSAALLICLVFAILSWQTLANGKQGRAIAYLLAATVTPLLAAGYYIAVVD